MARTPQPITASVLLSGLRRRLRLSWSVYAGWDGGAWLVDLYTGAGELLVPSTPLVLTSDLWDREKGDPRVPQGSLAVVRVSGEGDPGATDLGGAVELRYTD